MNPIEPSTSTGIPAALEEPVALDTEAVEEVPTPSTESIRAASVAEDAALVEEANSLIASLAADPMMAIELAQTWLRDLGIDIREDQALSAQDRAEVSELLANLAQEAERAARASAAESNLLGQIFGWIGTGIAVAVSLVTSVFTGGASLALGAAAVACMIAAQTVSVLGQEGVIRDPSVASGVALGLTVLATVLSLGGSAAGAAAEGGAVAGSLAAQVAQEAALRIASEVADAIKVALELANAGVGVATGVTTIVAALETHEGDMEEIEGDRHELHADIARGEVEDNTDGLASIMRQARRMAETMARVREARSESANAAILRA